MLKEEKQMNFDELYHSLNISPIHEPCSIHGNELMYINGKCGKCIEEKENIENFNLLVKIHEKMKLKAGIPHRFLTSTFDNYECTTEHQKQIKNDLKNFNYDKNICFLGKTGNGKTHLACALLSKRISNTNFDKEDYSSFKLRFNVQVDCAYIKFYYLAHLKVKEFQEFKKIINKKFLIIDEVGTSDSDFKNNLLFEIIDERYDNILSTMLISNLPVDAFKSILTPASYSRIKENFIVFDTDWEDFRLIKSNTKFS